MKKLFILTMVALTSASMAVAQSSSTSLSDLLGRLASGATTTTTSDSTATTTTTTPTGATGASLGDLLGRLASGATGTTTTAPTDTTATTKQTSASGLGGLLGNLLSNVLGNDKVTVADMVGTWRYDSPAVAFESDDLLTKAGGVAAATALENKLVDYYKKIGFDGMTLTVAADSTFTMKSKRLSLAGHLTPGDRDGQITFHFTVMKRLELGAYAASVAISGNRMTLTYDTSKLMSLVNTIAVFAGNKTLSTLNSMLQQFDGMEAGYNLAKSSE